MKAETGHRERLRIRFEKNGFAGFHDYEVLEYLLTFIFRQGDVKPVAKELIKTFGSFSRVLDAPAEKIEQVNGMGKISALNLVALRQAMAYYFKDHLTTDTIQITKLSALVEMLRASIGNRPNEVLFAIFLNAKNEVLATNELGEGTVSQSSAFPRRIVEEALKYKATSVILAHNHPGGVAEPSDQDISITNEIKKALGLIDISLQDHIIINEEEYYSFKRENLI